MIKLNNKMIKQVMKNFGGAKKAKVYDWRDDPSKNIYRTTTMDDADGDPKE